MAFTENLDILQQQARHNYPTITRSVTQLRFISGRVIVRVIVGFLKPTIILILKNPQLPEQLPAQK